MNDGMAIRPIARHSLSMKQPPGAQTGFGSKSGKVSQAEVVRHHWSRGMAENSAQEDPEDLLLRRLHATGGGLAEEEAAAYLAQGAGGP